MTETARPTQRSNQKERTRAAIVTATQELIETNGDLTMPGVAAAARVSEATAYRYFPDLVTLLGEAVNRMDPKAAMEPVAGSVDPVERIGHAAEVLGRAVVRHERAIRAIIAATIVQPRPVVRPGNRFAFIRLALEPWSATAAPAAVDRLTRELAVVISAEALFTLVDMCDLDPEDAVASLVRTARTLTTVATA
ncbi:TetR/AcrR family transcriptional regulator [Umezawaea sp. Da 62-37]|uniref:TetR/AcrR family transcriptional regulator n=1 Tax=Umezawaea sp. Da 62-37 TaxID=3075927 RepID=UPI0028F7102E|nr:TetR/AcrR family transcriptional regulator [Umezawaea sp. Da 62-37]WNV85925.1 TetR/AcrR family transcriptional regulator [Umezawaea sp. Da 62-37]